MSAVKNQEEYGTCWAIAASDSIETQLRRKGIDTDLSEWHLAYFTYKSDKSFVQGTENVFNSGGTNSIAAASLARWNGMITEKEVPYKSARELDKSLQLKADYKVTDVLNTHPLMSGHVKHSNEFLKELIQDQNAVAAAYYSRGEYYNEETNSHYCNDDTLGIDHAVILMGWDDSYPKENFINSKKKLPENDGAWLAKNSWGSDWGDNGYFWISYEDKSLCEAGCYFSVPGETYSANYQYDETGWAASISADGNQKQLSGYMSNVFTAQNSDPLTAVSFYTTEDEAEYEISVYRNVKINSKSPSPVNGELAYTASGTQKYTGYHTVVLDAPVFIDKGEQFSVAVKLTNHSSPYVIPMEASSATVQNGFFSTRTYLFHGYGNLETDPSYISPDGKTWYTTTGKKYSYNDTSKLGLSKVLKNLRSVVLGNVCLKAFTTHMETTGINPPDSEPLFTGEPDVTEPAVTETVTEPVTEPEPPVTAADTEEPEPAVTTEQPLLESDIYDINRDGRVDSADYVIMTKMFFCENTGKYEADINEDGVLNIADLILLKERITDISAVPIN